MNRSEFIAAMEAQLIRLPKADRDDILSDYEAHFASGLAEGRTEEEVSAQLGDPVELAAVYLENLPAGSKGAPYVPQQAAAGNKAQANNASAGSAQPNVPAKSDVDAGGVVAVVLLSIFVALPVLWTIIGIIASIFGTSIACVGVTVGLMLLGFTTIGVGATAAIGMVLIGLAVAALAVVIACVGVFAVKGTILLVKWYINCCKKLIGGNN